MKKWKSEKPTKGGTMMRFIIFSILMIFTIKVQATTLIYKSFDDLVKECEGIILVTVTKVEMHMDEQGGIYTYVTLGNLKMLYGRYDRSEFTLKMEGGIVKNQGLLVEGSPNFSVAEKLILFMEGNGRRIVPIVGWSQGIFRIQKDPKSLQEIITDNYGNRVFDIKSGQIIKERRIIPEVKIVCNQALLQPYSELREGGYGETRKGEIVKSESEEKYIKDKKVMTLEQFIREIQVRTKLRKIPPPQLVSLEIGEKIKVLEDVDARPKEIEIIKQLLITEPSTESSPGVLPKRINIKAEKEEAIKKEIKKKQQ